MTWIKTNPISEGDEALSRAIELQRSLYPIEYSQPVHPTGDGTSDIVASHSLIPDALHRHGLESNKLMVPGGLTEDDGAGAARALLELSGPRRPTAVTVFNDRCATGVP